METIYFKTSDEWRSWLKINYNKEREVWLVFYKKESGKPSIEYEAAVEEALCFGWIDSIIKKIDESKYARKFSRRNTRSKWSELNKMRVEKLLKSNRITPAGKLLVDAAKKGGQWYKAGKANISILMPDEFKDSLNKNKKAKEFFEQLANSSKKQFIIWINTAKRNETKETRIKESIHLLAKGEKLGLR